MAKKHYVVVGRYDQDTDKQLPSYAYGPFKKKRALKELDSDTGVVFSLLTIDAKSEGYIAEDCYTTTEDDLEDDAIIINPSEDDA